MSKSEDRRGRAPPGYDLPGAARATSVVAREPVAAYNVADAKRGLSELLGRVAYGGETVLITRRGRPMARLVPIDKEEAASHLADVAGWLEDDSPFFAAVDEAVAGRRRHEPRAVREAKPRLKRGAR